MPLRHDAGEGRRVMRLDNKVGPVTAVGPQHCACIRVDGVDKNTHERPDAGGEKELPLMQDGASTRWPA